MIFYTSNDNKITIAETWLLLLFFIYIYNQAYVNHIRKAVDLFPWKKNIKKSQHKRYDYFYLIKQLRILFLIKFIMKQLHLMIEILRGLTKTWNS